MLELEQIKTINYQSQRGINFIESYENGKHSKNLSELYFRYSTEKQNALNKCINDYIDLNGYDFRLISHNCNFFTVGYIAPQCDKKTGEIIAEWLIIHTYKNIYKILWLSNYDEKELFNM